MVNWTQNQKQLIEVLQGTGPSHTNLEKILPADRTYRCHTCHKAETAIELIDGKCPDCHNKVLIMCPLDHCDCGHDIVSGIETCPICGDYICPECGSHDVVASSRVTGYLSPVNNWNAGKQQELTDRQQTTNFS